MSTWSSCFGVSLMSPSSPTPAGMLPNRLSARPRAWARISSAARSVRRQRMPQAISNHTPPAEMIPPRSGSNAATPPMGNPYPQCASGMVMAAPTSPGSRATLPICSSTFSSIAASRPASANRRDSPSRSGSVHDVASIGFSRETSIPFLYVHHAARFPAPCLMRDRKHGQGGALHFGATLQPVAPSLAARPASPAGAFALKTERVKHDPPLARGGQQRVEPSHQRQFQVALLEVDFDRLNGLYRIEFTLDREHRA